MAIGNASGVRTEAIITAMDAPLGRAVGNALEVIECIEVLKGGGPQDLIDVSVELTARMLVLGGVADDLAGGRSAGARRDRVRAPGSSASAGSSRCRAAIRASSTTTAGCRTSPTGTSSPASRAGFVTALDAELVGRASVALGAGRDRVEDPVDPAVGIMVVAKPGDAVRAGRSGARAALPRSRAARRGDARWRARRSPLATSRRAPGRLIVGEVR